MTRGEARIFKSSNVGECGICGNCGGPVLMRYTTFPDSVWVWVGTLDRPGDAEPYMKVHLCAENEIPWLTVRDGLPRQRGDELGLFAAVGLELDEGQE